MMPVVERVWEWRFAAPPERLWPALADTARFNEAAGFPRYAFSETPLLDGRVRRTGTARRFGLRLTWDEGVPEWVAPRRFAHRRDFHAGPLRWVETAITLDPAGDGASAASRVRYRLRIEPRFRAVGWLLRCGGLRRLGQTIDRLFRDAAAAAIAGQEDGFRAPPPTIPPAARKRVRLRAETVAAQGYRAVHL